MKIRQRFLFWFVMFAMLGAISDVIKYFIESGVLNRWFFVLTGFSAFVIGWIGVLFGVRFLQQKSKETKKDKKKKDYLINFIYFMLVWSVFIAFDMMRYSLENNMLDKYYFFGIGLVCMFIGWMAARLENIVPKSKQ